MMVESTVQSRKRNNESVVQQERFKRKWQWGWGAVASLASEGREVILRVSLKDRREVPQSSGQGKSGWRSGTVGHVRGTERRQVGMDPSGDQWTRHGP